MSTSEVVNLRRVLRCWGKYSDVFLTIKTMSEITHFHCIYVRPTTNVFWRSRSTRTPWLSYTKLSSAVSWLACTWLYQMLSPSVSLPTTSYTKTMLSPAFQTSTHTYTHPHTHTHTHTVSIVSSWHFIFQVWNYLHKCNNNCPVKPSNMFLITVKEGKRIPRRPAAH